MSDKHQHNEYKVKEDEDHNNSMQDTSYKYEELDYSDLEQSLNLPEFEFSSPISSISSNCSSPERTVQQEHYQNDIEMEDSDDFVSLEELKSQISLPLDDELASSATLVRKSMLETIYEDVYLETPPGTPSSTISSSKKRKRNERRLVRDLSDEFKENLFVSMEGPSTKSTNSSTINEKVVKKNREEKLMEHKIESEIVKKVLNGIDDPQQKNQILLKRCVESERQLKVLLQQQKQNQKTIQDFILEKDNLTAELTRVVNTKSKLESLCRELQHQNKTIKDDSLSKIREEEEHRKATQAKFQESLSEIQKLMNENSDKNKKLEQDNQEMSQKFKTILTQYEEREKQMDRINKQMELVTQLNEAKLAKASVEALAERETFLKQVNILEETINLLKKQLAESLNSEKNLRAQVDLYSSKYSDFSKTFDGYKTDMTKMTKKTFKMEKEMLQWKIKYEKANAMLLDLISEKQVRDEHITKTAKQLFHLQKLCRTLSAEKKAYYNKLVESGIEIPEVKDIPKDEVPQELPQELNLDKGPDKLDEMIKSRDELKKNLEQLQGQLSSIALSPNPPTEQTKKSKSKKSKKHSKQVANDNEALPQLPAAEDNNCESECNPEEHINGNVANNNEVIPQSDA